MKHLSIRVAWHDHKWDGTVCRKPYENTYCTCLPRIASEKDEWEEELAGREWNELTSEQLPVCKGECGAFMNKKEYKRGFTHNYAKFQGGKDIPHKVLLPTTVTVPPYSFFGVPFWYMLKGNSKELNSIWPDLPADERSPFQADTWVYNRERQYAILKYFFDQIQENKSLVAFYAKNGNPIDEESRRLIVGLGTITKKYPLMEYESTADYTYPFWDRLMTHSIREDLKESQGFLIPYQEYLDLPEEYRKDGKNKYELMDELKITLNSVGTDGSVYDEFSYGCGAVSDYTMLSLLSQAKKCIEKVIEHNIVGGDWAKQLKWIDQQVSLVKKMMGPFPAFSDALNAIGISYAYLIEQDLRNNGICQLKDNPWHWFEELTAGRIPCEKRMAYFANLPHYKKVWETLNDERKQTLQLLSRFQLNHKQIKKWFESSLSTQLIHNPYILAEEDKGDTENYPISVSMIDAGVFKDPAIQGEYTPQPPTLVETEIDHRRIRALLIAILENALEEGDTLLSLQEMEDRLDNLKLEKDSHIPMGYVEANKEFIQEKITLHNCNGLTSLQLSLYNNIEYYLRRTFLARAKRSLPHVEENWEQLIMDSIDSFSPDNPKHQSALQDQTRALQQLTERKLSILHGPAGTGKTTVMGALFGSKTIQDEGILLLAPTGKARVRLGQMADTEAFTIAQFLTKQGRFDWATMRPKFDGKMTYKAEQNVIIDECSMLTEEDFYALFKALDLAHVKRIILVGDPYQLPPIGPGRPFADLCNYLESIDEDHADSAAKAALARLSVVVRTTTRGLSDTLTLASWFSGLKPNKNSDEIFSRLSDNAQLNDLSLYCWEEPKQLETLLKEVLIEELGLDTNNLNQSFYACLGLHQTSEARKNPSCVENQQILTPVRNPLWGTYNLNKLMQQLFQSPSDREKPVNIGVQKIYTKDKVIQLTNEKKDAYPANCKYQLSNGQIGYVHSVIQGNANIAFSGINNQTFGYRSVSEEGNPSIELAYSITVHKSQGSDFKKVFLILPKTGPILSRELVYTALTRAKEKLVILLEGDSPHWLFTLSNPLYSATAKRNTNLFRYAVREERHVIPYVEGLIHKTRDGRFVRSKSEVIIANLLLANGVDFKYEREYIGVNGQKRIPDFSFIDASGELILWEHLGMLHQPHYREDWEKKLKFYKENGFVEGETLFTTRDTDKGAIDSTEIDKVIHQIKEFML